MEDKAYHRQSALAGARDQGGEAMGTNTHGQRHDRIPHDGPSGGAFDMPSEPKLTRPKTSQEIETSLSQKMMSAVSGSILTSLLGTTTALNIMFLSQY